MNCKMLKIINAFIVKAGLCKLLKAYYYSSATFYEYGVDDFSMLTHYKD